MRFTFATWNLAKRTKAASRVPEMLEKHGVDLLCMQEAQGQSPLPDGYVRLPSDDPRRDTQIVARASFAALVAAPSPLSRLGAYAAVATVSVAGVEFVVASIHSLARPASPEEIDGLEPDDFRRPGVPVPWVNDIAFGLLQPVVKGRRFIVGADLNTSRLFSDGGPEFFERAAGAGWIDLVSAAHGQQVPTFFSSRSDRHQLDYLFCDRTTADLVTNVEIDTSVATRVGDATSDHAIVVASAVLPT